MEHLLKLQGIISSETDDTLSHKVIYHHLSQAAMSPLISRDMSLYITLDTTTYTMTRHIRLLMFHHIACTFFSTRVVANRS